MAWVAPEGISADCGTAPRRTRPVPGMIESCSERPPAHSQRPEGDRMRRRYFISGLLAVAAIGGARAQQSKGVHRIALVAPATSSRAEWTERSGNPFAKAFFDELRRLGYIEGQNL